MKKILGLAVIASFATSAAQAGVLVMRAIAVAPTLYSSLYLQFSQISLGPNSYIGKPYWYQLFKSPSYAVNFLNAAVDLVQNVLSP
jgi:hypothetical protein